jgi:enterobactin synthetase component D
VLRSTEHLTLAHGACVVVELADEAAARAHLPLAEQQRALELAPVRRAEYTSGRTALHFALAAAQGRLSASSAQGGLSASSVALGAPALVSFAPVSFANVDPILSDDRGAPIVPDGWRGSVSHKGSIAAALVAPAGAGHIGIDLERAISPRGDIGRRILTAREQAALPDRGRAVTLRFAIKEAIYKALDPHLRRYIGFTEVELDITEDAVLVTTDLPFAIEATWREHADHWLVTARTLPIDSSPKSNL